MIITLMMIEPTLQTAPFDVFSGAVRLPNLGLIRARGDDAATFLHGQLSQDITGQTPAQARLAAYCNAKGRMQASFTVLHPGAGEYWLVCSGDLLPATLKRLSMFVLRAKARLDDASADLSIVGLAGSSTGALPEAAALDAPWRAVACRGGMLARLPDALSPQSTPHVVPRHLWAGPLDQAETLCTNTPALSPDTWAWLEVSSGVARIESRTFEHFVPQMINFELVGGVNFKKGCYPGQEVVARSQYLGKLKRRSVLMHADVPIDVGQDVFSDNDPSQPCGMVVNAAPHPSGGHSALVEIKLAVLAQPEGLHLGTAQGPQLRPATLPYALPDDDAPGHA